VVRGSWFVVRGSWFVRSLSRGDFRLRQGFGGPP
jgi:hypothetical protein